ncbi:hypothetical protein JTB14_028180 [Gonioctena quinquepunctata]|nr:hypothetical protein JTB14_028180 [Gonioctena quinquepunctata]
MAYHATALLHLKLIGVKAKQGDAVLTSQEKDLRKATTDEGFNVPQPLFTYPNEIGTYTDKMGKETWLDIPNLPITKVFQNMGGYHANAINSDTHNFFKGVPSLGIAGDMVMALASEEAEPVPNFHIGKPAGTDFTNNLIGKFSPIGQRRPEIKQRSAGLSGGKTQVIKTQPKDVDERVSWMDRSVQGTSAAASSTAHLGAANYFGFQLYKEDVAGGDCMSSYLVA